MTPITYRQALEFSVKGVTVISEVDTRYNRELEIDYVVITYYVLDDVQETMDVYNTIWLHQYRSIVLGYF